MPHERNDDTPPAEPAKAPADEHTADPAIEDLDVPEDQAADVKGGALPVKL
jgi:hypothetical protein